MTNQVRKYTMVLPVRHFRLDAHRASIESSFAEHLRMMRTRIADSADLLVIASPGMSASAYKASKGSHTIIDSATEGIAFETLFSDDTDCLLRAFLPVMRKLRALAGQSMCVHSGLSWSIALPFEFSSIIFGLLQKRRTVFVVDIDYRKSAYMSYRTGSWSVKSYLICKYLYDPARTFQIWVASRFCSLVLLKGKKMALDFGHGRPNVRDFLDASHSEKNIIDPETLKSKLAAVRDTSQPLRIVYFGRLTAYKGIDRCLKAVAAARNIGANITFDIIGGGEEADSLRSLVGNLRAEEYVTFHGSLPFDQEFFQTLYRFHLLLAAPLREDTPRSALDAMAAGISYLAYDTYYYQQLTESGAGKVVPWLNGEAMAEAIRQFAENRELLVTMIEKAVNYARQNTQEIWLERRLTWTMQAVQQ